MQTQSPGCKPSALSPAMSCLVTLRANLGVTKRDASPVSIRICRDLAMNMHVSHSGEVYRFILVPALVFEYKRKAALSQELRALCPFLQSKVSKILRKIRKKKKVVETVHKGEQRLTRKQEQNRNERSGRISKA